MIDKQFVIDQLMQGTAIALDMKARKARRDQRRNVARKVYAAQEKRLQKNLAKVLEPLFEQQIKETSKRLLELVPPEKAATGPDASAIVVQAFDANDPKWRKELIDRTLPVLAIGMLEAMTAQMLELGIDPRKK